MLMKNENWDFFFIKTKSVCLPVWKTFQFTVANIHEILEPSLETKAHKKAKKAAPQIF